MILNISSHPNRDFNYYKDNYPFVMERFFGCTENFYQDFLFMHQNDSNYLSFLSLVDLNIFLGLGRFLWNEPVENLDEYLINQERKEITMKVGIFYFKTHEEAEEWQDLNKVLKLRDFQFKTTVFDRSILLEYM